MTVHRNLYLAGAAFAVTCITAALVILIARPHNTPAAAPPTATTTSPASGSNSSSAANRSSRPVSSGLSTSSARPSTPVPSSAAQSPVPRGTVPKLPAAQQTDPLAVAETVVATLYSVDPAADGDSAAAARRAAYLLTPQLATSLTAPQTTGSGAQWQDWAGSGAHVTVTTKKIAIAWTVADNRLRVVRNIGFTQTVHTTAGAAALPQQTLAVTLTRDADTGPWRVEHMETP